jgi:hypothetical protein
MTAGESGIGKEPEFNATGNTQPWRRWSDPGHSSGTYQLQGGKGVMNRHALGDGHYETNVGIDGILDGVK